MAQEPNFYVIVDRIGTRPVTRWSPAAASLPAPRNFTGGNPAYGLVEDASRERELKDEVAT